MSQHHCRLTYQGKPVTVTIGWDRPLQGYFMFITRNEGPVDPDDDADDDEYVYSNLSDRELIPFMGLPPTLNHFINKLLMLGIQIPTTMIEEVVTDSVANVGNREMYHHMVQQGTVAA